MPAVAAPGGGACPRALILRPADLYEHDFYAWTQRQARELGRFAASRPNLPLDLAHLAEEIRDLGKERRDALRGRTTRVIEHLLLLEHSVAREPRRGWTSEIVDFRRDIEERLTRTLRRDLASQLPRLYEQARRGLACKLAAFGEPETAAALPAECPYTLDQVLGDWWPEEREGT
jgi:hypothetical protein